MANLLYLKHACKLSDEELVERWAENVYWQYFNGMAHYESRLPCDASQTGRFRSAIGEAGVEELLKATIDTAVSVKAVRPAEFERVHAVLCAAGYNIRWLLRAAVAAVAAVAAAAGAAGAAAGAAAPATNRCRDFLPA